VSETEAPAPALPAPPARAVRAAPRQRRSRPRWPLSFKFVLATAVVGTLAAGSTAMLLYRGSVDTLVTDNLYRLRGAELIAGRRFTDAVGDASQNALFIARMAPISGLLGAEAGGLDPASGASRRQWLDQAASALSAMMQAHPQYVDLSLAGIADDGREVVAVRRIDGQIVRADANGLRSVGDRPYFAVATRLGPGEVATSPIERARSPVDGPSYPPVLRIATPVHDDAGRLRGVVSICLDAAQLFDIIGQSLRQGTINYIADHNGEYLSTPPLAEPVGDGGVRHLQDDFPELAALFSGRDEGFSGVLGQSDHRFLATAERIYFDADAPQLFIVLASMLPKAVVSEEMERLRDAAMLSAGGVLLLGLMAVAWLTSLLTKPLRKMTLMARGMARGDRTLVELGTMTERNDETGDLARAFVAMNGQIARREQALVAQSAALSRLAGTDPLTGILNRRAFFEKLEHALADARRSGLGCAMLMIDVDHFKEINDTFGHQTGDRLLVAIARSLGDQLRETDILARLGGDEFAIIAQHLRMADSALTIAEKVVAAITSIDVIDGNPIEVGASVGVSVFPSDDVDANTFAAHADLALYKSKVVHDSAINFYDAALDAQAKAWLDMKTRMPIAIAEGRFILHFQPIVDAASGVIVAAEGLARWRESDRDVLPPGDFIEFAEKNGLISDLGSALFEHALVCLRGWMDQGLQVVPLSINVSPLQCRDPDFGLRLISMMQRFDIPPSLVNIEITESAVFKNREAAGATLDLLRSAGVGVHIDDFGTGYSSLSLLREMPFDALKIDRSFVAGLGREKHSESIVQAIADLSRRLGFRVIGEGVETEAQRRMLAGLGVHYLQGFHFARPLSAEDFARRLAGNQPPRQVELRVAV
jgi:diguanylate cyclase (GGDEF)-like protein